MQLRTRLLTTWGRSAAKLCGFTAKRSQHRHARPRLQLLEGRAVPATFTVTNTLNAGTGSLRQAVLDANGVVGADTVVFDATANGTITLASELSVTGAVSFLGNGTAVNVISGGNAVCVFNTTAAPAGTAIHFSGLTVSNGSVPGNGAGIMAGDESVTLTGCTVTGNKATGDGGGVYMKNSFLILQNCTISDNTAFGADNFARPYQGGGNFPPTTPDR